jgi:hypothetical protein
VIFRIALAIFANVARSARRDAFVMAVVVDDDDYQIYGVLENVEEDLVLVEEEAEEMEDESFE